MKKRLKDICKSLPHEHLHLFQFLICVVDRIQKNQNNQMTIESLAIIFAPTCIGIDGMGDLIIKSPSIKIQSSSSSNNNNKQVFQRARSVIWNTIRKKTLTTKKCPFESPSLGQMSAVKEITTWIKIFQFFMTYPQIFGNLTGHRINKSFSFNERNVSYFSVHIYTYTYI